MGYAFYEVPDPRTGRLRVAGYAVEATCDFIGCNTIIDRGLGYVCGDFPEGHRDEEGAGCGLYLCGHHDATHACARPECNECEYVQVDSPPRWLAAGHEGPHRKKVVDEPEPDAVPSSA